jgi:hypothetical protein
VSTLSLVPGSTRSRPASTRDTVAVDTPARRATSYTLGLSRLVLARTGNPFMYAHTYAHT